MSPALAGGSSQGSKRGIMPMSWLERLHPAVSRMEQKVLLALHEKGQHPIAHKQFCLLYTEPDYYFPDQHLAVYLDGHEVHRKREERDTELRELLAKRYGIRVLTISYKRYSKKAKREIMKQILEALK